MIPTTDPSTKERDGHQIRPEQSIARAECPVDLHQAIRQATLTPAERRVAAVVLEDYPQSALLTARGLAAMARVSPPSVSRFTAKLGYRRFTDLQSALREDLRSRLESPIVRLRLDRSRSSRTDSILADVIERDLENLHQTREILNDRIFESFVDRLARSEGKIYVSGSKKARILAEYLAIQLNQIRTGVQLLRIDDGMPDSMLDTSTRDVFVVLEPRRATAALIRALRLFKEAGACVAAISDEYPPSALAHVDYPIPVVVRGVSAFDSYTAVIAVINAIVAALIARSPAKVRSRLDRLEQLNVAFGTWHGEATR